MGLQTNVHITGGAPPFMIDMFCAGSDDPCLEMKLSEDGASPKFLAFFIGIALWWTNIAMENGHRNSEFTHETL